MTSRNPGHARVSRRRFIAIAATSLGASSFGASSFGSSARGSELRAYEWRGVALGANASLTLEHHDEAAAKSAIDASLAEVARLERIFSLFDPESALSRLNRDGHIDDAPADLRLLLAEALSFAELSDGAFDPTVQPLWALYARHFSAPGASADGPNSKQIEASLRQVGWRNVVIDGARIRFRAPKMSLTLNGIAQGYITDRVGDLLRARGFEHVLVNMGEELALGPKSSNSPWRIGVADPVAPSRIIAEIPLTTSAAATSGGYGCHFDPGGRFAHILDPRTGVSARKWASVTVVAPRATTADALSTAISIAHTSLGFDQRTADARAYVVPLGARAGFWL